MTLQLVVGALCAYVPFLQQGDSEECLRVTWYPTAAFVGPGLASIRLLMHFTLEPARAPTLYARLQLFVAPLILLGIFVAAHAYGVNTPECIAMRHEIEQRGSVNYWSEFAPIWVALLCVTKLFSGLNHEWLNHEAAMPNFGPTAVAIVLFLATTLIVLQHLAGVALEHIRGCTLLDVAHLYVQPSLYTAAAQVLGFASFFAYSRCELLRRVGSHLGGHTMPNEALRLPQP